MELNCENLFDCRHDSLKNDYEFCEGGARHWSSKRYWHKLNNIGKELVSCGGEGENWVAPDFIALIEVENDSVVFDLTRKSLLRTVGYEYFITKSPDPRGIDVALLYHPFSFTPDTSYSIRIPIMEGYSPTRDILYVRGKLQGSANAVVSYGSDSTFADRNLHLFVVHAPSRSGGQSGSEPYRLHVSQSLCESIDSINRTEDSPDIIIMGDFNDYYDNKSLKSVYEHEMINVSSGVQGLHGAKGTYRYQGEWGSLDHILLSSSLYNKVNIESIYINDLPFLCEEDKKYAGIRPLRTFQGFKYNYNGFSDHFPLVLRVKIDF